MFLGDIHSHLSKALRLIFNISLRQKKPNDSKRTKQLLKTFLFGEIVKYYVLK